MEKYTSFGEYVFHLLNIVNIDVRKVEITNFEEGMDSLGFSFDDVKEDLDFRIKIIDKISLK